MKRIAMILSLAAVLAMLTVTAAPAMAATNDNDYHNGAYYGSYEDVEDYYDELQDYREDFYEDWEDYDEDFSGYSSLYSPYYSLYSPYPYYNSPFRDSVYYNFSD